MTDKTSTSRVLLLSLCVAASSVLFAQSLRGTQAGAVVKQAEEIEMSALTGSPGFITVDKKNPVTASNYAEWIRTALRMRAEDGLQAYRTVGSSRVDLQACKLEYSIVSPK